MKIQIMARPMFPMLRTYSIRGFSRVDLSIGLMVVVLRTPEGEPPVGLHPFSCRYHCFRHTIHLRVAPQAPLVPITWSRHSFKNRRPRTRFLI